MSSERPARPSAARTRSESSDTAASAAQHSQACSAYSGVRTRSWRSRQAASSRKSAAADHDPLIARAARLEELQRRHQHEQRRARGEAVEGVKAREHHRGHEDEREGDARGQSRQRTARARAPEAPADERERRDRRPGRHAVDVQQHPAGERGARPGNAPRSRAAAGARVMRVRIAEAGERGEAAVAVLRAAIGRERLARQREPVALAARLGVDDPARELREARLDVREPEVVEVKQPQLARRSRWYSLTSSGASRAYAFQSTWRGESPSRNGRSPSPLIDARAAAARARRERAALRERHRQRARAGPDTPASRAAVCTQVQARKSPNGCAVEMRRRVDVHDGRARGGTSGSSSMRRAPRGEVGAGAAGSFECRLDAVARAARRVRRASRAARRRCRRTPAAPATRDAARRRAGCGGTAAWRPARTRPSRKVRKQREAVGVVESRRAASANSSSGEARRRRASAGCTGAAARASPAAGRSPGGAAPSAAMRPQRARSAAKGAAPAGARCAPRRSRPVTAAPAPRARVSSASAVAWRRVRRHRAARAGARPPRAAPPARPRAAPRRAPSR